MMWTLASLLVGALATAFCVVCVFMMMVILIQKPKGGGLSGAFGGAGGSATDMFGAKTGDVLTWFTVVCFVLFLLLAMGLTWTVRPDRQGVSDATTPDPTSTPAGAADIPAAPIEGTGTSGEAVSTTQPAEGTSEVPATQPAAP